MRRSRVAIVLIGGVVAACADRVTAPEIVQLISALDSVRFSARDSSRLRLAEDGLALSLASVNLDNLPSAARVAVTLDGRDVEYNAVVAEVHFVRSRWGAAGCPSNDYTALLLWRPWSERPFADAIVAGSDPGGGAIDATLGTPTTDYTCGTHGSWGAVFVTPRYGAVPGTRGRLTGRLHVRRHWGPPTCGFVQDQPGLAEEGITCRTAYYDLELESSIEAIDSLRSAHPAANGAAFVRVRARRLMGAVLTIDCAVPDPGRPCGERLIRPPVPSPKAVPDSLSRGAG
jgi:hypothetical protein